MAPLMDAILREVPPPAVDPSAPFAMIVSMIERWGSSHGTVLGWREIP